MSSTSAFPPIRGRRDIEALETIPLADRLFSWDVNAWIARGLDLDPNKVAIRYIDNGDPQGVPLAVTYRDLKRSVAQVANLLHALGVGAEDAVVVLLPTVPRLYTVLLASLAAGVVCCLNWMAEAESWIEPIRRSGAKVVVALGPTPGFDIWERLQTIRHGIPASVRILSVRASPDDTPLAGADLDLLASHHSDAEMDFHRQAGPDDIAAYMQSGGTTASPKLVKLTHGGFAYKFWANMLVMAYAADDVVFSEFPMFHIAGFFSKGIMAIAAGVAIVIPSPFGARDKRFIENYWKFVERFQITILSGVPTTLAQLTQHPPQGEDLCSLRSHAVTGSTAFPAEIARRIEAITGVRMLGTYGATEYTQNVTQAPRDGDPKYGSAGLRLPYTQLMIAQIDASGSIVHECAVDEIGVVLVKGPGVTPGYVDPRHDAGVFISDGWFNSGDLGRLDVDGYLWLTGRVKDVIIRGGHNIDPATIEEALLRHGAVLHAAAVGKPDAHAGELPIAYVALVAGARVSAEALRDFAAAAIAERAAIPKEVVIMKTMPLTDVGKPAKAQLRVDAARRAFADLLTDVGSASLHVAVTAEAGGALRVALTVDAAPAARPGVEQRIRERMKYFAAPYAIQWTRGW